MLINELSIKAASYPKLNFRVITTGTSCLRFILKSMRNPLTGNDICYGLNLKTKFIVIEYIFVGVSKKIFLQFSSD